MNNTKFSTKQINEVFNTFRSGFTTRVNKCGNLKITNNINPKSNGEFYVLHAYDNGTFLWRRHYTTYFGSKSGCPLNMKNRNKYNYGNGFRTWSYEDNCFFNSFDEAMDYIKMYFKKYRNIELN